jgi:hypothetical protein
VGAAVWSGIENAATAALNGIIHTINALIHAYNAIPFLHNVNTLPTYGGGHAGGGPLLPGYQYLVGERGPELLTMGSMGGHVTPNAALGGDTVVNVYVTGSVTSERDLVATIRQELIKVGRRNGGAILGVG